MNFFPYNLILSCFPIFQIFKVFDMIVKCYSRCSSACRITWVTFHVHLTVTWALWSIKIAMMVSINLAPTISKLVRGNKYLNQEPGRWDGNLLWIGRAWVLFFWFLSLVLNVILCPVLLCRLFLFGISFPQVFELVLCKLFGLMFLGLTGASGTTGCPKNSSAGCTLLWKYLVAFEAPMSIQSDSQPWRLMENAYPSGMSVLYGFIIQ